MSETLAARRSRKRLAGIVDQLASVLASYAGAVFAAGAVAPLVAVIIGIQRAPTLVVAAVVLFSSAASAGLVFVAARMKARAKVLDDDQLAAESLPPMSAVA